MVSTPLGFVKLCHMIIDIARSRTEHSFRCFELLSLDTVVSGSCHQILVSMLRCWPILACASSQLCHCHLCLYCPTVASARCSELVLSEWRYACISLKQVKRAAIAVMWRQWEDVVGIGEGDSVKRPGLKKAASWFVCQEKAVARLDSPVLF